jgi:hypothetical protein
MGSHLIRVGPCGMPTASLIGALNVCFASPYPLAIACISEVQEPHLSLNTLPPSHLKLGKIKYLDSLSNLQDVACPTIHQGECSR